VKDQKGMRVRNAEMTVNVSVGVARGSRVHRAGSPYRLMWIVSRLGLDHRFLSDPRYSPREFTHDLKVIRNGVATVSWRSTMAQHSTRCGVHNHRTVCSAYSQQIDHIL
jgi:hypothetical protein